MSEDIGPTIGPYWTTGAGMGYGTMQVPAEVPTTPKESGPAIEGVKTGRQMIFNPSPDNSSFFGGLGGAIGTYNPYNPIDSDSTGSVQNAVGRAIQSLASTYFNYRRMRSDGIVAIGRAMADALISLNKWEYRPRDPKSDHNKETAGRIERMWETKGSMGTANQGVSLREFMLSESCRAKDYGNHTLEVVYGEDEDGYTIIHELLQCLPETTRPLVVQGTRTFAGVRNWGMNTPPVDLSPEYCVRFIYDAEGGSLFGRSRFENCKDWIALKWAGRDKIRTDMNIAIGNTMMVGYPQDDDNDPTKTAQNKVNAGIIGVSVSNGLTVSYPTFSMKSQVAMAQAGVDASKLRAWPIDRLNTGQNSFAGFKIAIDLMDEQILFGLICLPRSVREANHGSRADAAQHTDSMGLMAWVWITYVCGLAQNMTDDVLVQWGEERGSVAAVPAPLDDETVTILRLCLTTLLTGTPELGPKILDLKALCDKLGVRTLDGFDQQKMVDELAKEKEAANTAKLKVKPAGGGPFPITG